jgi:hypothetical protein
MIFLTDREFSKAKNHQEGLSLDVQQNMKRTWLFYSKISYQLTERNAISFNP